MKNLFREILENLPAPKIEIIPDDPKDQKVASQLTSFLVWKIVKSRSEVDDGN